MLCTTVVHSHVNAIVHILQDCTAKYCGMDSETGGTKTTLVEITPRIISGMPRMCQINSASIYTLRTEAQLTNQKQSPPTFSSSSKSLGTTRISRYEQNRRKTSATTDTALTMVFTREPRNVPNLRTETHITIWRMHEKKEMTMNRTPYHSPIHLYYATIGTYFAHFYVHCTWQSNVLMAWNSYVTAGNVRSSETGLYTHADIVRWIYRTWGLKTNIPSICVEELK